MALACGDSYGSKYECDGLIGSKFEISTLPDKPVAPRITDDTKMATILLKHYIENRTLQIEKLTLAYKFWAKEEGSSDGIGIQTAAVLLRGGNDKTSQGNGALMRIIPFGLQLIEDGKTFEEAVALMNMDASITHSNETVFIANKLCLDIAVNGLESMKKQEYSNLLSRLYFGQSAWVIHTLFIVLETLKQECNFLDGFKYIVSQGGDTDTNCAIYGAIRGYKHIILNELDIHTFLSEKNYKFIQFNNQDK